jgi:hypothetical protein
MILEGIVTTMSPDGAVNIAPMGPHLLNSPDGELQRFLLRPFQTAQTYRNLVGHPEGVLHVTDDVLLLARAAVGRVEPPPPLRPAENVRGWVLCDCCRFYEFRIVSWDKESERTNLGAEVVHWGRGRDFFGLNRAKHAVVEAAILATRLALLPHAEIEAEYRKLMVLVDKTGGSQEKQAFALLSDYVAAAGAPSP